jgi:hypothetical protein
MDLGVCLRNAVGNNTQFSAFKEQQAICGMLDHVPIPSPWPALALVLSGTACFIGSGGYRSLNVANIEKAIHG